MTVALVIVALVCVGVPVTAWWLVSEALSPRVGDDVARDYIRTAASGVRADLGYINRMRNAETFAARILERDAPVWLPIRDSLQIEPVAWSGRTTGNEVATLDVRFTATVTWQSSGGFGARGNTAGSATACYRYLLQLYRDTGQEKIDCPDIDEPPVPVAEVIPALPRDAKQRMEAVLLSAAADSLASDVRAAFPEDFIFVDTATHDGELVAAVGVPAERECLVAVRLVDGTIAYPGYDRIWLEPGEVGCKVALYTAPPR